MRNMIQGINMSYHFKVFLLCFSIVFLLVGCAKEENISETAPDSPISNAAEFKYLVLDGSPYNRGLIHGKSLKKEINELRLGAGIEDKYHIVT